MPSQPLTAGIIGAGIAGLGAAIALRRAGLQVEVYERSRFKNEIGAAISAPPNATAILRRWGFDFVAAKAVPNLSTRYALAQDLATVFEFQYEDIETVMGSPSLSFHRVDLHNGLRALATEDEERDGIVNGDGEGGTRRGKGTPVTICLGCEVRSIDCEDGVLTMADGTQVRKDLVIIADGAHSTLLTDFLGRPAPVQPTGRSIYRWLVSMDDVMVDPELAEHYRDKLPGFLDWLDATKRTLWVNYTCRDGSVLNNAVVHDTADLFSSQGGWCRDERGHDEEDISAMKETVLETLSNFHPAARRIVSMASEDGIKVHRHFKRPPLESFVRGRTAIIGDAAHVMLPSHAAGSAIAIESASVLEVLFRDVEDHLNGSVNTVAEEDTEIDGRRECAIKERLQLFDKLRIPRCNLTMLVSNAGSEGLRVPGVEQEIRRFYSGPLPPKDALPWSSEFREVLFHYDAFQEAEQALKDEKTKQNVGTDD
ncbi:FAD/NAD(P)-binding domain-containing protein [Xylaria digitata]|nr:FAD/NAD(P)-binding domain-containing protein [Xylaria digitata]